MKAGRFHARRDVRVDDVRKPSDIAPDEALVRNEFAASAAAIFTNTPMGQFLSRRPATLSPAHRSTNSWA